MSTLTPASRRPLVVAAIGAALAFGVAACGSSSNGSSGSAASGAGSSSSTVTKAEAVMA
jgi:hypothetical protein